MFRKTDLLARHKLRFDGASLLAGGKTRRMRWEYRVTLLRCCALAEAESE